MANEYAITAATDRVALDANRHGQTTFTVSNRASRSLPSRARVVTQLPEASGWFTVHEPERTLAPAETQQFSVSVSVPDTAAAGDYAFRLDVVGVENPDEQYAQGQSIVVTVPPPVVEARRIPWWIYVVAGVALLLVVGAVVFLLLRDGGDDEPVVVTQGQVTLEREQFFDFDAGVVTSGAEADLTIGGSIADERALFPVDGSQIGISIAAQRTFEGCDAVTLSANPILIDAVNTGNHLCVRTTEGNLTEALIESAATTRSLPPIIVNIRFSYTTFEGN